MTVLNKIRLTDEGKLEIMVLSSLAIKLNKSALKSYIVCKKKRPKENELSEARNRAFSITPCYHEHVKSLSTEHGSCNDCSHI